ncbi:MAG: hypothetical protein R2865_07285 [Deinococcales bacterium]
MVGDWILQMLKRISLAATEDLEADLTLLDMDVAKGLERVRARGVDRLEQTPLSFHERVRQAF